MFKLLTNQHYIACIIAVGVFVVTSDSQYLRSAIDHGLQAVLLAKQ